MPDSRRKAVHVDAPIGKVLDAYVSGPDAPRLQGVVSAGLFLYFAMPDSVRPIVQGFYESWRSSREPHFHVDQVKPGPPLVGLHFNTQNMPEAFWTLLASHLQRATPAQPPPVAPVDGVLGAPPLPIRRAKRRRSTST